MPSVAPDAVARILEWSELQPVLREPHTPPPREQALAIGGDEMRETTSEPKMPMEPDPTVHCVDHADATIAELLPLEQEGRRVLRWWDGREQCRRQTDRCFTHWQAMTPSAVAGDGAATLPL